MRRNRKLSNAEVRAAKKWLERRGITADEVSPRKFAQSAKELDKSFRATLELLAKELSAGQV